MVRRKGVVPYLLEKERQLFAEEPLADRLGDLFNKSIRLLSRSDFKEPKETREFRSRIDYIRKMDWSDGTSETFFNPMKVIALFLTKEELVVCEADIDSIDGDLREKIFRIMLSDIVSIGFTSERVRLAPDSGSDITLTRREQPLGLMGGFNKGGKDRGAEPLPDREEMRSKLEISRTDGGVLHFPIKSEIVSGVQTSALDQDVALTEDEVAVDRMVNELNRVVRGSRTAAR